MNQSDQQVVDKAIAILESQINKSDSFTSPKETATYLRLKFAALDHEVFSVLWLDNVHRPITLDPMFRGTIDGASVYPREVVKSALHYEAAACILSHNHPSGVCEPSQADQRITKKIQQSLDTIDVRVLDHIIVSTEGTLSFAEQGIL